MIGWRDQSIDRMALETGAGGIELRIVAPLRGGPTQVAHFATEAACMLAIKNQRIQFRVVQQREPVSKGDDLGCLSVVSFAL